jgi:hypothetical protein
MIKNKLVFGRMVQAVVEKLALGISVAIMCNINPSIIKPVKSYQIMFKACESVGMPSTSRVPQESDETGPRAPPKSPRTPNSCPAPVTPQYDHREYVALSVDDETTDDRAPSRFERFGGQPFCDFGGQLFCDLMGKHGRRAFGDEWRSRTNGFGMVNKNAFAALEHARKELNTELEAAFTADQAAYDCHVAFRRKYSHASADHNLQPLGEKFESWRSEDPAKLLLRCIQYECLRTALVVLKNFEYFGVKLDATLVLPEGVSEGEMKELSDPEVKKLFEGMNALNVLMYAMTMRTGVCGASHNPSYCGHGILGFILNDTLFSPFCDEMKRHMVAWGQQEAFWSWLHGKPSLCCGPEPGTGTALEAFDKIVFTEPCECSGCAQRKLRNQLLDPRTEQN